MKSVQPKYKQRNVLTRSTIIAVIAASLGFFVDLYDIIIVSVVRQASLIDLGISQDQLLSSGVWLLNVQMAGMLMGGFLWGSLGDKKGRITVLFGSILTYSLATLLSAFSPNYETYLLLRFIAGIGLAGELGAAITLSTEVLPQKYRGLGPAIIASFGMLGAIFGSYVGGAFSWQFTYILGGVMGLALLFLRLGLLESDIFKQFKQQQIAHGSIRLLFSNRERVIKYISVIAMGFPGWYVNGIVMTFTPEIAAAMGMVDLPKVHTVFMVFFIGFTFGDVSCGFVSQMAKSRTKAIALYLGGFVFFLFLYFLIGYRSIWLYYSLFAALGVSAGYTIVLLTLAAEQTGTNLRATATTSALNLIRASVIPQTILFHVFIAWVGIYYGAMIVGVISISIAWWGYRNLRDTFYQPLTFVEET